MAPLLLPLSTHHHTASLFLIIATAIAAGMVGNSMNIPGVHGASSSTTSSSTTWCVARSDASTLALQTALDYACGAGADCAPIQSDGLCYLPNTMQAHVSYAFDSYYQRQNKAPGSCDFSGTATIAQTDPSYGSCVYPSSLSTAGGTSTPTAPTMPFTPPSTSFPSGPPSPSTITSPGIASTGSITGFTPGMTPMDDNSSAFLASGISRILVTVFFMLALVFA